MAGLPLLAVKLALLEWFRAAELSCDRAATLVNRDPLVTCRTLMVLPAARPSRRLSLDAFIRQAGEYGDRERGWDRIARLRLELGPTHPIPVRRVHEIMSGCTVGEYDRIVGGDSCAAATSRRAATKPATPSTSTASASGSSSRTRATA